MSPEQKRAIDLALEYLRETKPDDHGPSPADNWTDADWAILRKAIPPTLEEKSLLKSLSGVMSKETFDQTVTGLISRSLSDDPPFSVEKGCWGIIEDAIHRRGFFASGLSRTWRSLFSPSLR